MLAEASELEHNLLCSYLFALFSLKRRADEGLLDHEHLAIQRWRKELLGVCVEEMVHLAQVANITSALGALPHFNRPNLPAAPGYHPAHIDIGLTRFSIDTLQHFVFLERPDGVDCRDSAAFAGATDAAEHREEGGERLIPAAPDYATVGEFYSVLRSALEAFVEQKPESAFSSDGFQLRGELIDAPTLVVVKTIKDARLAIDRIVEQGEGALRQQEDSHFSRFTAMLDELENLIRSRPAFDPARPVGDNPVMRNPQARGRTHVVAPQARACLDAFNAVYWMMLRALAALYAPAASSDVVAALVKHMLGCMHLLGDLADPLTQQPADMRTPGVTAGPSFTMFRHAEGSASIGASLAHLRERCPEIAAQVDGLGLSESIGPKAVRRLIALGESLPRD